MLCQLRQKHRNVGTVCEKRTARAKRRKMICLGSRLCTDVPGRHYNRACNSPDEIASPHCGLKGPTVINYIRDLRPAKRGLTINLRCKNPEPLMSALGQKQTSRHLQPMSALPPKADIHRSDWDVCFVSESDVSPYFRIC